MSLLDKLFSPGTLVFSTLSRGFTADFVNPEVELVESGSYESDRWRFTLQEDGNAVLLANGIEPVFRTNTAGWFPEDDEWPQAIMSDTNIYGDGWTRTDPRSGDAFF